jgi:outer membrane protein insertion porin family
MIGNREQWTTRSPRAAAFAAALLVCALFVAASPAGAQQRDGRPEAVGAIQIVGSSRVSEASILTEIGIRSGDSIRYAEIERAMKRLWATQQFKNIDIYAEDDLAVPDGPILLRVVVEEQPLIADVEFRGLQNLKASTVRDTVGLRAGQPFSPAKAAAAEAIVRSLLARKGFFVRSVEHRLEELPDRPGERRLVFDVAEGQKVAIAEVTFDGNEVFSDGDLAGVLGTKAEGFLWFRGGTFDEERFRTDLRESLPSFYASNGYIDFSVLGDSLVVDEQTGKAMLVVEVDEGAQYRLASFDVEGNRRFASEDLRRYFEQERGGLLRSLGFGIGGSGQVAGESVFDAVAFEQATEEVRRLYSNTGYLYAQVQPLVERVPTADGEQPAVNVFWQIEEGQPAFIDEIRITGNTYTHEDVIRSQLIVIPGDVYSEERLIQSYQRISALGFFETPLPAPQIVPNTETGDVTITFEVKEKQTGSVNFGTALGGATGVAGFLGYDQPNLFGQAKSGHLRWEFGRYSNNFEASYSDPQVMGTRYSGSLSVFSSRDRFFTFREGQRRRTGSALRVGIPLPTDIRNSRLSVGYSLSRTTYQEFDDDQTSSLFSLPPGVQSTLSLGLNRSTIDHPVFPTAGTRTDFDVGLNGGLLGGDGNFQKVTISSAWYVPVGQLGGSAPGSRPIRTTLGLSAEVGALFGDATRFPFERFWMGGVQFGNPLRGYEETTVTPNGVIPRDASGVPLDARFGDAYLRLSAEYAIRLNDNISFSTFYDAGNVWRGPSEINPMRLARGAGIGLMLVTPFGPLGLDYAYGFDKPNPGWQLHFKFGQAF